MPKIFFTILPYQFSLLNERNVSFEISFKGKLDFDKSLIVEM